MEHANHAACVAAAKPSTRALAGRLQNNAHIPKKRHYGSQQQNRQCEARVTVGQLLRCSLAAMLQDLCLCQ